MRNSFDIVPDDMPAEVEQLESVQKLLGNVDAWAEEFASWIDPTSDEYAMQVADTRREGAEDMAEAMLEVIRNLIYSSELHGFEVSLGEIYDRLKDASDVFH